MVNFSRGVLVGLSLASLAVLNLTGCGQQDRAGDDAAGLSRIIGHNDLVRVDRNNAEERAIKAIGRMELGCTVTHLGGGIAITAGHCFADRPMARQAELPSCIDRNRVTWGVTYDHEGELESECQEVLALEYNSQRDYAIFRVAPYPEESLSVADYKPEVGERISILSHPRKRPLEWSGYCTIEGYYAKSERNQFRYECDTEGGSSGAAILNSKLEIIGIHNYYNGEFDRNGGTSVQAIPLHSFVSVNS